MNLYITTEILVCPGLFISLLVIVSCRKCRTSAIILVIVPEVWGWCHMSDPCLLFRRRISCCRSMTTAVMALSKSTSGPDETTRDGWKGVCLPTFTITINHSWTSKHTKGSGKWDIWFIYLNQDQESLIHGSFLHFLNKSAGLPGGMMFGIVCFEFFWGMKGNFFRLLYGLYNKVVFVGWVVGGRFPIEDPKRWEKLRVWTVTKFFGRHGILSNFNSLVVIRRNPPENDQNHCSHMDVGETWSKSSKLS